MKQARKPNKNGGPSPRDRLSEALLTAFEADFQTHGISVIEAMREKSPDRYAELAARLIVAAQEPSPDGYSKCNSVADIGRQLLREVGLDDATDEQVEAAIVEHDRFEEALREIAAN